MGGGAADNVMTASAPPPRLAGRPDRRAAQEERVDFIAPERAGGSVAAVGADDIRCRSGVGSSRSGR